MKRPEHMFASARAADAVSPWADLLADAASYRKRKGANGTLMDEIEAAIRKHGGAMRCAELSRYMGRGTCYLSVPLGRMVTRGRLLRPERGLYRIPEAS